MDSNEDTHPGAAFIADMFGPSTEHPIFLCSLLNVRGSEPVNERFVTTRRTDDISGFARKWDRAGRALYFCVNTLKPNARRRCKENISELNGLFADIDFKDIVENPEQARHALARLMCPASMMVGSGHGLHLYWLFKEGIEATAESVTEVEALLRLLADHVGGDLQAAEVSRLLRLPGSHNSKDNGWLEVAVEAATGARYEIDDLRDWLEIISPVLHRKPRTNGAGEQSTDPFLELAKRQGFRVPVDVEARLRDMRYQGPGESGIHATQLSVSASLLSHGEPVETVVAALMEATRVAAAQFAGNWNWRREERALRAMCATWLAKYPQTILADPEAPAASRVETEDGEPARQSQPQAAEEAKPPTEPPAATARARRARPSPGHVRPTIRIVAGKLPDAVAQSSQALVDAGFQIFARGPLLVYPITATRPASNGRTTDVTVLLEVGPDLLLLWLAEAAAYIKFDKRSKAWVHTDPPRQLATTLLAAPSRWPFPPIAGVIASPTLRPDGTLLAVPGYDPGTQLYFVLDPTLRMPPLAEAPTQADAKVALNLLKGLLSEFSFDEASDQSVALSLMLTLAARPVMAAAPLHLVRAHQPGTGKSYLVDMAAAIVTGRPCCPVISAATNAEEAEKRLGALLREGAAIVALDNCSSDLEGDVLCQLVERPVVRIRILGHSEAPEFENKAAIIATGNNVGPKGDMIRRTLTCNLVADVERPELRRFAADPVAKVLADRGAYLAACLTIVRAYRAAGTPDVYATPLGSYGQWSAAVRAPLLWLGEVDPIRSMEIARKADVVLTSIRELFALWRQYLNPGQAYSAFEIAEEGTDKDLPLNTFKRPELRDFLLQVAGERGLVSTRRLGAWLRSIEGRIVDGTRIAVEQVKPSHRAPKFRLNETKE